MRPFSYARPASLDDALRLLRSGAAALAGGTDLLGLMKDGIAAPERLVDLTGVPGLRGWQRERGKGVRIGALTPLVDLETSAELAAILPIVPASLRDAATVQLRTMGTVGGNLLQRNRCWYFRDDAFPCWLKGGDRCFAREGDSRHHALLGARECVAVAPSDLAPALIACDASVTLRGGRGSRTIPLSDLYVTPTGPRRVEHTIRAGEIIVEVRVPERAIGRRGAYLKAMERKAWTFAQVSVAAAARMVDGKARDARVVVGGVAPVPWRVPAAERALEGSALDDTSCERAAEAILAGAEPLRDNGYKLPLARELIRRSLRSLAV